MKISFCSVLKTNAFIFGLCSSQRLYLCSFGPSSLLIASIPYPQSKNVKVMQIQLFLRQNWQAFGTCAKTPVPFSDSYHGLCPFFRYVN